MNSRHFLLVLAVALHIVPQASSAEVFPTQLSSSVLSSGEPLSVRFGNGWVLVRGSGAIERTLVFAATESTARHGWDQPVLTIEWDYDDFVVEGSLRVSNPSFGDASLPCLPAECDPVACARRIQTSAKAIWSEIAHPSSVLMGDDVLARLIAVHVHLPGSDVPDAFPLWLNRCPEQTRVPFDDDPSLSDDIPPVTRAQAHSVRDRLAQAGCVTLEVLEKTLTIGLELDPLTCGGLKSLEVMPKLS